MATSSLSPFVKMRKVKEKRAATSVVLRRDLLKWKAQPGSLGSRWIPSRGGKRRTPKGWRDRFFSSFASLTRRARSLLLAPEGRARAERPPDTSCLRGWRRKDRVRPCLRGSAFPRAPLASPRGRARSEPSAGFCVAGRERACRGSSSPARPPVTGVAAERARAVLSGAARARARAPGSPCGSMRSRRRRSLQRHKHGDFPA